MGNSVEVVLEVAITTRSQADHDQCVAHLASLDQRTDVEAVETLQHWQIVLHDVVSDDGVRLF